MLTFHDHPFLFRLFLLDLLIDFWYVSVLAQSNALMFSIRSSLLFPWLLIALISGEIVFDNTFFNVSGAAVVLRSCICSCANGLPSDDVRSLFNIYDGAFLKKKLLTTFAKRPIKDFLQVKFSTVITNKNCIKKVQ